jgi:hypothetical protein
MDFITVDEMAEADTTMVSNPDGKRRRSDGSKK